MVLSYRSLMNHCISNLFISPNVEIPLFLCPNVEYHLKKYIFPAFQATLLQILNVTKQINLTTKKKITKQMNVLENLLAEAPDVTIILAVKKTESIQDYKNAWTEILEKNPHLSGTIVRNYFRAGGLFKFHAYDLVHSQSNELVLDGFNFHSGKVNSSLPRSDSVQEINKWAEQQGVVSLSNLKCDKKPVALLDLRRGPDFDFLSLSLNHSIADATSAFKIMNTLRTIVTTKKIAPVFTSYPNGTIPSILFGKCSLLSMAAWKFLWRHMARKHQVRNLEIVIPHKDLEMLKENVPQQGNIYKSKFTTLMSELLNNCQSLKMAHICKRRENFHKDDFFIGNGFTFQTQPFSPGTDDQSILTYADVKKTLNSQDFEVEGLKILQQSVGVSTSEIVFFSEWFGHWKSFERHEDVKFLCHSSRPWKNNKHNQAFVIMHPFNEQSYVINGYQIPIKIYTSLKKLSKEKQWRFIEDG